EAWGLVHVVEGRFRCFGEVGKAGVHEVIRTHRRYRAGEDVPAVLEAHHARVLYCQDVVGLVRDGRDDGVRGRPLDTLRKLTIAAGALQKLASTGIRTA